MRSGSASRAVRNRSGARDAAGAQGLADVAPVGVREADVEDQHVRRLGPERAHRLGAGGRGTDGQAVALQGAAEHAAQLVVVLADAR